MITQQQADNVATLLNTLEAVKDENFAYDKICKVDSNPFNCRTVACAFGHMPVAFPEKYTWQKETPSNNRYDVVLRHHSTYNKCEQAIQQALIDFGMNEPEFHRIFMGQDIELVYNVEYLSEVTKEMVINRLIKYLDDNGYTYK